MTDIDELYSEQFFRCHRDWREDYRKMGGWLAANLDFESVTDFGCGNGMLLSALLEAGKAVRGLDGAENALSTAEASVRPFIRLDDLRKPIVEPADLVACTEVAEHLDPEFADVLVGSIAGSARKWIYFTAATPGQGGSHHVNEQPHSYWIEKFRRRGFLFEEDMSEDFRKHLIGIAPSWFQRNSMIFKRG